MTTAQDLIDNFPDLLRLVYGEPDVSVGKPRPPDNPEPGCVLFLNKKSLLRAALDSDASTIVVHDSFATDETLMSARQTILSSPNPELALALVATQYFPVTMGKRPFADQRIHPSAVIAESASIAGDVVIGPNTVVYEQTRIGDGCVIGANSTIEAGVVIGAGSHIHSNVFVGHSTIIGERCEVHPTSSLGSDGFGYAHDASFNHYRHVHYGKVILEDDVHIGAGVTVDRGHFKDTVIGAGTKIDNHCHIAHNVSIGKNCIMVSDFIVAGTASIGDNNVFGGRCGVSDHVSIGSNMQFSGLSSVFKDVDEPGAVLGGHPLQPVKDNLRSYASLPHLPELRRNVAKLMSKLGLS